MTARRGFALLPNDVRVATARQGGVAAHVAGKAHEWTKAEAAIAGAKGGKSKRGRPVKPTEEAEVIPAHVQTTKGGLVIE
jgi:hypothetical protein